MDDFEIKKNNLLEKLFIIQIRPKACSCFDSQQFLISYTESLKDLQGKKPSRATKIISTILKLLAFTSSVCIIFHLKNDKKKQGVHKNQLPTPLPAIYRAQILNASKCRYVSSPACFMEAFFSYVTHAVTTCYIPKCGLIFMMQLGHYNH